MSRYLPATRPLTRCLRAASSDALSVLRPAMTPRLWTRSNLCVPFSSSVHKWSPEISPSSDGPPSPPPLPTTAPDGTPLEGWELDPTQTTLRWAEKELMRQGTPPVGSRRRRAALRLMAERQTAAGGSTADGSVPFELMPYQCFQEARKVLLADREEKLSQIAAETAKARKLEAVLAGGDGVTVTSRGGVPYLQRRLASLRKHIEELKVLADINDPQVKRRFEDGLGDMNKPIYRYLAEKRWRGRPLRIIRQRIDQFHLAPDLLPPAWLSSERLRADVALAFRSYTVPAGTVVDSLISEPCPRLRVQVFDRGPRLVTVLIVDADVPDTARDGFAQRVHLLAANLPLSPTDPAISLSAADPANQLILPWLPPYALKGSPAHRLAVFVFEQPPPRQIPDTSAALATVPKIIAPLASLAASTHSSAHLDAPTLQAAISRDNFSVNAFAAKHRLTPIGCTLFRTKWDAGTASVMDRIGAPGADLELRPVKLPSLKPPRKRRGWEAKREGPKFRHLWKYTHRIASPKRKFVR